MKQERVRHQFKKELSEWFSIYSVFWLFLLTVMIPGMFFMLGNTVAIVMLVLLLVSTAIVTVIQISNLWHISKQHVEVENKVLMNELSRGAKNK